MNADTSITLDAEMHPNDWMNGSARADLVSIILPTHNRAAFLPDALHSVVQQHYRPLELVVIDDGSQDQTQSVLESWVASLSDDPELQVIILRQPNRGAPAARNAGLRAARGEFIQFMDSDDALLPHKIAWQVAALRSHPEVDYVWADTKLVSQQQFSSLMAKLSDQYQLSERPSATRRGIQRIPTNAVSGLFRRELSRRLGPWSETLQRHQDWEYMLRMLHDQPGVQYLPAPLYVVRLHDKGRISDLGKRHPRSIRARLDAAEAAERYATRQALEQASHPAYRKRLRARYWKILRDSLAVLAWSEIPKGLAGFGRSCPRPFRVGSNKTGVPS